MRPADSFDRGGAPYARAPIPDHALILAGTATSSAAAIWARLSDLGWPVTLAVAAPALLVGWPDLVMPDSLIPHLGALLAVPAAFAGLTIGLVSERQRRREEVVAWPQS